MRDVCDLAARVTANVAKVLVGKQREVEYVLVAALARGHVLLEDVPGVGKTTLVRAIARSLGCEFRRVQFTPDLLPSDITGTSIWNRSTGLFDFRPGPVFSQVLLADEINRASPKTQAALLECMGERQVTVDGLTHSVPEPFLVLATQNPVEYEGTFPLPEAQLDRFLIRLRLGYPTLDQEREILHRRAEGVLGELPAVAGPTEVLAAQSAVETVYMERSVEDYLLRIVHETRNHSDISLGASPRGAIAIYRCAQALAALCGNPFAGPDDVKEATFLALPHRLILRPEAHLHRRMPEEVLAEIVTRVPVPGGVRSARPA